MPILAVTVGDLGDIISLIDMVLEIRTALDDSSSSDNYQHLCTELEKYADVARTVRFVLQFLSPSQLPEYIEQGLSNYVRFVKESLSEAFYSSISWHSQAPSRGGSGNEIRDWWRRGLWSWRGNQNAINDIHRDLGSNFRQLKILLFAAQVFVLILSLSYGVNAINSSNLTGSYLKRSVEICSTRWKRS